MTRGGASARRRPPIAIVGIFLQARAVAPQDGQDLVHHRGMIRGSIAADLCFIFRGATGASDEKQLAVVDGRQACMCRNSSSLRPLAPPR
jgi:hypothetical protein